MCYKQITTQEENNMSISIIVVHINDALALHCTPTLVGKCQWLITVEDEWEFMATMLVEKGRARRVE